MQKTITVNKGLFIYEGNTKAATETFEVDATKISTVILRDIIEGVLLDNLKVEEGVLDEMAREYLKRKGKPYSADGVLDVASGLLQLHKHINLPS